jgi:ABC-type nitrate/sulfonate/bicarbonate transport system ATPase subunit
MTTPNHSLLRLEGVTKVFYTDEVETHALSGIHLEIENGEFVSIAGPIRRRAGITGSTASRLIISPSPNARASATAKSASFFRASI